MTFPIFDLVRRLTAAHYDLFDAYLRLGSAPAARPINPDPARSAVLHAARSAVPHAARFAVPHAARSVVPDPARSVVPDPAGPINPDAARSAVPDPALVSPDAEPVRSPVVPAESIRIRAYEVFQRRGGQPGDPLDDWRRAEAELQDAKA